MGWCTTTPGPRTIGTWSSSASSAPSERSRVMSDLQSMPEGVVLRSAMRRGDECVLSSAALAFAVELEREFRAERRRLLARRQELQRRLDSGWKPDFLPETKAIR